MSYARRQTPERIVELARGIARNDLMVVDMDDRDWQHSIMMLAEPMSKMTNLGAILVPVKPHLGGLWLNGKVPAITLECIPIAQRDLVKLNDELERMMAALFPDN